MQLSEWQIADLSYGFVDYTHQLQNNIKLTCTGLKNKFLPRCYLNAALL